MVRNFVPIAFGMFYEVLSIIPAGETQGAEYRPKDAKFPDESRPFRISVGGGRPYTVTILASYAGAIASLRRRRKLGSPGLRFRRENGQERSETLLSGCRIDIQLPCSQENYSVVVDRSGLIR